MVNPLPQCAYWQRTDDNKAINMFTSAPTIYTRCRIVSGFVCLRRRVIKLFSRLENEQSNRICSYLLCPHYLLSQMVEKTNAVDESGNERLRVHRSFLRHFFFYSTPPRFNSLLQNMKEPTRSRFVWCSIANSDPRSNVKEAAKRRGFSAAEAAAEQTRLF